MVCDVYMCCFYNRYTNKICEQNALLHVSTSARTSSEVSSVRTVAACEHKNCTTNVYAFRMPVPVGAPVGDWALICNAAARSQISRGAWTG